MPTELGINISPNFWTPAASCLLPASHKRIDAELSAKGSRARSLSCLTCSDYRSSWLVISP